MQPTLLECLKDVSRTIVSPTLSDAAEYTAARACLVYPPGEDGFDPPSDQIIVQPTTVEEAAAIVQCAAATNTTVSPRSGAHGFTGDACRGLLILDLSRLHGGVSVDSCTNQVTWSAGLLHGQLYDTLWTEHALVVPGGAEMMVGTGGLWLGCGRGRLTSMFGMTCEVLTGIEYIDSKGEIRLANRRTNSDMYWMARGGGGLFPGIVTKFRAQAFPLDRDLVFKESCFFTNTESNMKGLITSYFDRLNDINDGSRQMFVGLSAQRPSAELKFLCFGCSFDMLNAMTELKNEMIAIVQEISSPEEAEASCQGEFHSYESYLLHEATWDDYLTPDDLQKRSMWPEWFNVSGLQVSLD